VLSDERPIVLGDEDIRLVASQQVPFVTREVPSPRGQMQRSISYQNVGAMVRLRTSPWTEGAGAKRCAVAANIEYSDMLESGVQISDGVFAPVFLKMTADQVIQLTSGKPALISCLQRIEGSKGKPAQFAVLIVRIELGAK
jgi:hypothetical protein